MREVLQLLSNPNSPMLVLVGVLVVREVLQLLSNPHFPVLVLVGVLVVREVLQLLVSVKRYLTSLENWIEIIMIVTQISIQVWLRA